ncbi:MAG: right-handed parallel beta-helix repeat-containing protein [Janthinobacterium lividum]
MRKKQVKPSHPATSAPFGNVRLLGCFLLWLLLGSLAHGQSTLHKDLKKDFGAVGDGRTNDQAAFQKAADFFNKRAQTPAGVGRAVLRIPAGTYLVGQPDAAGMGDVLHLAGCRNLTVLGDDSATTEIRYADGLRYGAFDPTTKQVYESPKAFFTDWGWGVGGATAIVLQNCDNVEVANLSLNGNSGHLLVGGHWGDTGIQVGFDGLFVSDSRRIRLRRLAVHHFGRDGIQVLNHLAKSLDDPARENILLENSRFDYNGRQGLSITGVNGLRAVKCSFSHTGRVIIPALGKPLYSNPGAGVDLEPEGGYVANVRLENCRFVDNAGQGIVSDHYGNGPPNVKNIVIRNCLVWGVTNWSAWVRQPGFLFENCRLYGAFVTGSYVAASPTRFVGCTFEDRSYHGQPAYGQFLVYSNHEARALSFANCRFVGTRNYLLHASPAAPDTASRFQLRGCTFELDYTEPPLGGSNQLLGAVFSGSTSFDNGPHRTAPSRTDFVLGTPEAAASAVVAAGGRLQLLAAGCRYLLPGGLRIGQPAKGGRASVVVGADNVLVLSEQLTKNPELYIGPNSRLVIKKGGALEVQPHTRVTIAGQLLVEDGAHFYQDPLAEVRTIGKGTLRVNPQAIKDAHPTWASSPN